MWCIGARRARRPCPGPDNPTEQSRELWTFTKVGFAKLAEDIGAVGIRVERAADFAPAVRRALAADRPVILDVPSDIEIIAPAAG